ncbi:alpha/beta hydrolase [Romboutsia sp. 1001216sp1]|uniref:alpha/beta hydrolase n=1 Tax=unclassified Romboutsia TaxID=2626894 RepID=UPI00189EBD2C|nr:MULTISPECIES: alpha/beta hydrolase [unclassified Romboutsia]MDB8800862.1 alpha/beta hydrolase [Romboutsia sp. 1001216sp1]MDB8812261.1 alpha/beta hydrolase [Romboutsia sp. 1001216sp1]
MNKSNKIRLKVIGLSLTVFIGVSTFIGYLVYDGSVGSSQKIKNEDVVEVFSSRENKPLERLKNYENEDVFIDSPENGYKIEAKLIKSNIKTDKTVILVHGIESYYYEYLDKAYEYLEKGYNAVIYNQRHTGNTGGDDYTFGLYERYDLENVAKFIHERYPNGLLGVHGHSMGAGTALMHSSLNEKNKYVDFYIVDSPYHEMADAIRLGIEAENIPLLPVGYAKFMGDIYTQVKSGFSYEDVKPYKEVQNITTPMFLIHGKEDKVCSPQSSKIIYENIPHDKKELWLIDNVGHVNGYDVLGDEYFNRIFNFIDKNVINNG